MRWRAWSSSHQYWCRVLGGGHHVPFAERWGVSWVEQPEMRSNTCTSSSSLLCAIHAEFVLCDCNWLRRVALVTIMWDGSAWEHSGPPVFLGVVCYCVQLGLPVSRSSQDSQDPRVSPAGSWSGNTRTENAEKCRFPFVVSLLNLTVPQAIILIDSSLPHGIIVLLSAAQICHYRPRSACSRGDDLVVRVCYCD